MRYILCVLLVLTPPAFAEFNRTSGLIDIPTARILPHLGYRIGADFSFMLKTGSYEQIFEENMLKASLGLGDIFEVYFDIYTTPSPWLEDPGSFTAAIGFCHNFYNGQNLDLAWGIHTISYSADVSEIAHGDSTGWHDDLLYNTADYKKPYEVGSAFLVSTYSLNNNIDLTLGLGRGRYVGYGNISKYLNSNFYHEKGGDWGIGFFGGLEFKVSKNLSFIIENDGRDINVGSVFKPLPWEFGLALTKCEYFADWDEFRPRVAISLAYVKAKKRPGPGIIAGTVLDTQHNPLIAEIYTSDAVIPKKMSEPEQGSYKLSKIQPGLYEVYAWAAGYKQGKKVVEVSPDKTVYCDFVLEKSTSDIIGKVVDLNTNEPLVAQLTIEETGSLTESDTIGMFEFMGLEPAVYEIKAEAKGYAPGSETATVSANQTTEVLIKLMKAQFTLEGVRFDLDKATIKSEFHPILDKDAVLLKDNPDIVVEIQGHTCSLGSDEYNLRLSDDRAKAVVDYFITKHNIDPSRLSACGYGESNPVATNDTPEGRERNRRVDFVILE